MTVAGRSVGIMQGRLSAKTPDSLQSFPVDSWREEFERASELGFDTIEWLIDSLNGEANPVLQEGGRREIRSLTDSSGVRIDSLCAHAFIDGVIAEHPARAIESFIEIAEAAALVGIRRIVVPFLERASLMRPEVREAFIPFLRAVTPAIRKAEVGLALETDLSPLELGEFVFSRQEPALSICYDIGNATARGESPVDGLRVLESMINEIHVKDRMVEGDTVMLGQGDVPFTSLFAEMGRVLPQCPIVLETPVGDSWHDAAVHNLGFVAARISEANEGLSRQ